MSYEGYVQVLCEDGHLNELDYTELYTSEDSRKWRCPDCGKKLAFENPVDETNGIDPKTGKCPGQMEFEVLIPEKIETCDKGFQHVVEEARYKIPNKK